MPDIIKDLLLVQIELWSTILMESLLPSSVLSLAPEANIFHIWSEVIWKGKTKGIFCVDGVKETKRIIRPYRFLHF